MPKTLNGIGIFHFREACRRIGLDAERLSITAMQNAKSFMSSARISYYDVPVFDKTLTPIASYEIQIPLSIYEGAAMDKTFYRHVVDVLKQIKDVDLAVKEVKDRINGTHKTQI